MFNHVSIGRLCINNVTIVTLNRQGRKTVSVEDYTNRALLERVGGAHIVLALADEGEMFYCMTLFYYDNRLTNGQTCSPVQKYC